MAISGSGLLTRRGAMLAVVLLLMPLTAHAQPAGENANLAAQHLSQAIQLQTVSYDDHPSPDPATLNAFRAFLESTYPNAHRVMTRDTIGNGALLFTWPGSDPQAKPIILAAHMDVVPAGEQGDAPWQIPPFEGRIDNGKVHGRGAIDMKGQLISLFEAVESLAASGYAPKRTIYIALGSDEETSGSGAQAIAAALRARSVHAEFILDEGPFVIDPFELTGKRAIFIGVAEKGYGTLVVTATDKGGHSSVPPADPALVRLSRAVIAIQSMKIRTGFTATDRTLLKALSPDMTGVTRLAVDNLWLFGPLVKGRITAVPAGRALLGTTLAPTMMLGSTKENELPSVATARINVRIHPRDTAEGILMAAQAATARLKDVSVAWASPPNPPTAYASTDSPAYQLLARNARVIAGADVPVAPVLVFGATDSRYYSDLVDNVYRFQPYVLSESDAEGIHGRDEALSIGNIDRAIRFFQGFLKEASSQ